MLGAIFSAIVNAIYGFITAVANVLGLAALPAPRDWTVRDQLGDSIADINDYFESYMRQEAIKAGQFALRVNGDLVMFTAYTWAEPGYTITETTSVMRIASCTKTFTRAAALRLIMSGTLDPDAKVFELLGITENAKRVSTDPEPSDPRVRDITVWNLIGHTSGWDYGPESPNWIKDWVFHIKEIGRGMDLHQPPTKEEFAQFMFNVKLNFAPGKKYAYSNIGYLLLGMVIEKVSHQSYIDFLNDKLLRPQDINDTSVGATRLAGRLENEVVYEDPFLGPDATLDPFDRRPAPLPYGGFDAMTELMDSGGGLITSADSLSHFIFNYSVGGEGLGGETIVGSYGRHLGRRTGGMPGTSSVAMSFNGKNGSTAFDLAFIFNQFDKSTKVGEATGKLDDFVAGLENLVRTNFGG